jgi:hypothetical protein
VEGLVLRGVWVCAVLHGGRRPILRSFRPVSAARWTNRFPRGLGWQRSLPLYGATELSKRVISRVAQNHTLMQDFTSIEICLPPHSFYWENISEGIFDIETPFLLNFNSKYETICSYFLTLYRTRNSILERNMNNIFMYSSLHQYFFCT